MLFFLSYVCPASIQAQSSSFFEVNLHTGYNYYPGGQLEEELNDGYRGVDIKLGWQTYDEENWSAIFNYANYGVGYWAGDVGEANIFGTPMAFYGFVNFPLVRTNRLELLIGPALGLAFNLKAFDPIKNPQNDLTGGKAAAFFNPSLSAAFKLTDNLDLKVGANFIHMSNGGIRQPNTGFDMYGCNLGFRWHLNRKSIASDIKYNELFPAKRSKRKDRSNHINFYQAFGIDQKLEDMGTDIKYTVATTTLEYQVRFNEIHGLSTGINLFVNEKLDLSNNLQKEVYSSPALHVGHDLNFWRIAIRTQFGFMLANTHIESKSAFFMRLGLSVNLTNTVYFMTAVKSVHGFKADWADFGIGVRLFKNKL
jgi:hypothetical protein